MKKKTAATGKEVFSKSLQHAIMADRLNVELDLPKLGKQDVEDLQAILSGKKVPTFEVDMKRAINALTRSDRSAASAQLLTSILSDEQQPSKARSLAALNLSVFPLEKTEATLIDHLDSKDRLVQAAAIRSLGRAGSSKALDALQRLTISDERVRKQLSFATSAIEFRTKSSGKRSSDDLGESLGVGWNDFAAKTIKGAEVRKSIDQIWGATYGIELNPEVAMEFQCGNLKHSVFLNKAFKKGAFTKAIQSEKMIAGLVALDEDSHLTIRYVLLSVPTKDGATLAVARTDGDVLYTGETTSGRGGMNIKIRDVGLTGAPIEVNGTLKDDDVEVSFRVWKNSPVRKKRGVSIEA